jgi:hypothetical protein
VGRRFDPKPAAAGPKEVIDQMDDTKRAYREAENETKEQLRRSDGEESLEDKAANTADDIRAGLGNAGDELDEQVDRAKFRQEHGDNA